MMYKEAEHNIYTAVMSEFQDEGNAIDELIDSTLKDLNEKDSKRIHLDKFLVYLTDNATPVIDKAIEEKIINIVNTEFKKFNTKLQKHLQDKE